MIPLLVVGFSRIRTHYRSLGARLRASPGEPLDERTNTMLVLVGGIHKGVLQALQFAGSLNPHRLVAIHVAPDEAAADEMQRRWVRHGIDVELEIAIDPYRDLNRAIIELIESIDARWEQDRMIVVIPEFVVHHWWGHLLH
ncbi:MAG: amino acid permease, partial [Actinomycetota bacterium]|nr:amino acid permease [Actinomycetota bacterium]